MAYNVVIVADFGAHNTGLALNGKLFGTDGVQVGSTVSSGFVEAVAGLYVYVLAAPDSQEGLFVTYDSANTSLRRVAVIAPRETENADAKTTSRGTSTLTTGDIDARLTAYDAPTKAELDAAVAPLATASALATVANNVAAILVDTGTDGVAIAAATINAIADAVLGRSVANVEDTASIYTIAGLILSQFESSAPGTTWTIKKTDGVTTFATRTLVEDASAKPVTGVS